MQPYTFRPLWALKNGMIQTLLSSSSLRARGANPMRANARPMIIATQDGVRLLGYLSLPQNQIPSGLVILLHGWEGSADSTYILNTGKFLYQHGYAVFRLNFRDHDNSHHLNEVIFYAVLFDEVFGAVRRIAEGHAALPIHIVGFSLGVPTTLLIAEDDPIIPIEDFRRLELNGSVRLAVQRYGGHNGFLSGLLLKSWYEYPLVSLFSEAAD